MHVGHGKCDQTRASQGPVLVQGSEMGAHKGLWKGGRGHCGASSHPLATPTLLVLVFCGMCPEGAASLQTLSLKGRTGLELSPPLGFWKVQQIHQNLPGWVMTVSCSAKASEVSLAFKPSLAILQSPVA